MPPHEDAVRTLAVEWVRKAEDDVRVVDLLLRECGGPTSPIAFHAQQAVEKYLKAFLTWRQIPFPKTHDIERLLVLVASADTRLAESLEDVTVLTIYGVELRYPADRPEVSVQEAGDAAVLMHRTREAIRVALDPILE